MKIKTLPDALKVIGDVLDQRICAAACPLAEENPVPTVRTRLILRDLNRLLSLKNKVMILGAYPDMAQKWTRHMDSLTKQWDTANDEEVAIFNQITANPVKIMPGVDLDNAVCRHCGADVSQAPEKTGCADQSAEEPIE